LPTDLIPLVVLGVVVLGVVVVGMLAIDLFVFHRKAQARRDLSGPDRAHPGVADRGLTLGNSTVQALRRPGRSGDGESPIPTQADGVESAA